MTSSRYSKATVLGVLALFVLSAAATPAAAVTATEKSVPDEAAVGSTVEATITLDQLYKEPQFERWSLIGETELNNVTWLVSLKNPQGETITTRQYNGTSFTLENISTDSPYGTVTSITVTVRGDAPAVQEYTWPEPENFTVMSLTQRAGQTGSTNPIGSWKVHHFTTGTDEEPGSKQARKELRQARKAIDKAEKAGADVSNAKSTFRTAVEFYELGQFQQAVAKANKAESQARKARKREQQSQQTTKLLMYGGVGLVLLLLIGGGVYYWRNQGDDYDKLG